MRRFNECVFDDMIYDANTVYTGAQYAELLGSTDQRTIHVLLSEASSGTLLLKVQIEQSPDGIRWKAKSTTPEINNVGLPPGSGPASAGSFVGADNGSSAGDGLARLAITLSDPPNTPSAALRIYVTGRDRVKHHEKHCPLSRAFPGGGRADAGCTTDHSSTSSHVFRSACVDRGPLRVSPSATAQRKQTSVTPASSAPGHTAWMPRSCRSMCMVAASTSYAADVGPVSAVTAVR